MGIVAWIVVGAIAGFLANQVMGSSEGLLKMIILGIVGGLLGVCVGIDQQGHPGGCENLVCAPRPSARTTRTPSC